jgi:hypothetical protein
MVRRLIALIVLGTLGCGVAGGDGAATRAQPSAQSPNGDTAVLVLVAFQCSVYAEMSKEPQESLRLFRLGYDNGQRFLEAVRDKKIPEAELRSKVPIGVSGVMEGPTTDFMLGRIYETASTDAYDRVVKRGEFGLDLPAAEWRLDADVQKALASTEYRKGNCSLIK